LNIHYKTMDHRRMDKVTDTKPANTKACSICKATDHNKRTCPKRICPKGEVEDLSLRKDSEEEVEIEENKLHLMEHLKKAQDYKIDTDITLYWLTNKRPCNLNQIRLGMDQGLNNDYLQLFIKCTTDMDTYY